jgi:hypothetical protein
MKKSHFSNRTVYWLTISIIGGLLIWNLYVILVTGKLILLLPITIQAVLLGLIFTKNQYAKNGVVIWAIIFFAVASGLQFFGRLIQDAANGFENADVLHYLATGSKIIIGLGIAFFVNQTVDVVELEN